MSAIRRGPRCAPPNPSPAPGAAGTAQKQPSVGPLSCTPESCPLHTLCVLPRDMSSDVLRVREKPSGKDCRERAAEKRDRQRKPNQKLRV